MVAEGGWALNGSKTWISNGDIADFYVTFAKTDMVPSDRAFELPVPETVPAERLPARDQRAARRSGSPPWQPPRFA